MRKTIVLSLFALVLALGVGTAFAQAPVVDPDWEVFVIREGATEPPFIVANDDFIVDSIEIGTTESGQKAGLATDLLNGAKISQISTLHIDRLDDVLNSGSLYGPYFNIWVTDGLGHYAVLANEPSDAEWAGSPWDVPDWDFLKTKRCKVYETPGTSGGEAGTSWVFDVTGVASGLIFEDVADLIIAPPSAAYILDGANGVGSGAPDVLGTNVAYGYTWVFGDTSSNYVSGGDGFIVNGYSATATFSVQNTTQGTSYATIEAALAAANPSDVITVDDGTYNPPGTLTINMPLTLSGESEAGVIINIPAAGGYGFSVAADNVTLANFTLATNVTNQNFPIHASGTSNPPDGFDYLAITNVTISGVHRRTGFDIHGYNHVALSNLTSTDATNGNGLQVTGCIDVDMDNITTLNNAWGSIAIYSSNSSYLNRGSDDVSIDGDSCSLGEQNLYNQDEFGLFNTNIVVTGYEFIVRNMNYRPNAAGYYHYQDTFADASVFALGLEGVAVGSYILTIANGNATVIPGITLQAAVSGVASGKSISVLPGTYVEAGQIVIDKDLEIIGEISNRPIIMTDGDTGSSGDSRGWFLQMPGTHFVMRNMELDGAGYSIYQGIRSQEGGVLDNCALRNITYPGYGGVGMAVFTTYGNWTVSDCTFDNMGRIGALFFGTGLSNTIFSGNTYTGKGAGDWLDYACDISAGAVVHVSDCTVTDCLGVAQSDGSTSAGLLFSTHFGPGTVGTVTDCDLLGNTAGVCVGYDGTDTSDVTIVGCDFSGSTEYGVISTAPQVEALGNWWGHASGPLDTSDDTGTGGLYNPLGQGVPVTDNVNYYPWTGAAIVTIDPAAPGPINCSASTYLTYYYNPDPSTLDLHMFNATISAGSNVTFGTIANDDIFNGTGAWYVTDNPDGSKTITASTYAGSTHDPYEASNGLAPMFTIEFVAASEGFATIVMEDLVFRDPTNATIPADLPADVEIEVDCTAPVAVTNIIASPHHRRIGVEWTHDGTDVDHYDVFAGVWHNGSNVSVYPEYDDVVGHTVPTRPGDYAAAVANVLGEWDPRGSFPTLTAEQTWLGTPDRGVYYYEVFAVDAAGNASPPAAANDRATNYWLGDMDDNGSVAVYDMGYLGAAFGTYDGGPDYQADADVGPTDDWSAFGIPLTDDYVNFEDLMVFSMNYGVVSSSNKTHAPISAKANLTWVTAGEGQYALRLVDGTGIKGIRVRAFVPEGSINSVTAGHLLDEQSEMTFLRNIGDALDISVAVMGMDNGFIGSGDLMVISSDAPISMNDLNITIRGYDNSTIQMSLEETNGVLLPRVFALEANYPNPFNPMTKISFSLPEAQDVRLNIYGIDGSKVATLVNEIRAAGLHEVIWMGRDDTGQSVASGMYFYRIEAGPYSQVRKMTLMK